MYPSMNQLKIHTLPVTYENWLALLKTPASKRPYFSREGSLFHIGQVLARFIGIPHHHEDYYNQLYDYVHTHGLILLSDPSLNKTIDHGNLQSIQKVIKAIGEQKSSITRFVSLMDQRSLLPSSANSLIHQQIRKAMNDVLGLFTGTEIGGLNNPELPVVLYDIIGWSFNYLDDHLLKSDPEKKMPCFLWYGNYKKSHQYFLYFLIRMGCDLASFTPDGSDILSMNGKTMVNSFVHVYPDRKTPEPFPKEKRTRTETAAYRASLEIEKILHNEETGLFKPWQLREYVPSSITLKTTYDELFLIAREKAAIRQLFEVKNKTVRIPVLFAKINGVDRNRREYWRGLHSLVLQENSFLVESFPFASAANDDFRFHYRKCLDSNGRPDPELMAGAHYWKYGNLSSGLQKGVASAIRNICAKPKLRRQNSEKEEDVSVYLFTHLMQLPENILKILQKFDYSQEVPKLILYHNELNGTMTRQDASLLLLLNEIGVDLVIYNPSGQNDIEKFIDSSAFVSHWLDDVVFEQDLKEPSIVKQVVFRQFFKTLGRD